MVLRVSPRSTLVKLTFAPGTAAPEGSFTCPRIVPAVCAAAGFTAANNHTSNAATPKNRIPKPTNFLFIWPLSTGDVLQPAILLDCSQSERLSYLEGY
jgi:hypothetical protein